MKASTVHRCCCALQMKIQEGGNVHDPLELDLSRIIEDDRLEVSSRA